MTLTVTASGGASHTFYSNRIAGGGHIEALVYIPATASGISSAANLAITGEQSGIPILTAGFNATAHDRNTFLPRAGVVNTSGAALGYSSAEASAIVPDKIPIAEEAVKVVVTSGGACSGGDGFTATLDIYISGI